MKLEVLAWFFDFLLNLLGRCIEILFRCILLFLPLWVYLLVAQLRNGGSKVSNLTVYTNDTSTWQFVFPGFILVSINKNQIKDYVVGKRDKIQEMIKTNKYLLSLLLTIIIVVMLVLNYIK